MFWELCFSFFLSLYKGPASGLCPTLILSVAIRNPGEGRNVVFPLRYQWILGDVMFPAFPPAEQALQTRVCWGTAELCNIYLMTALQGCLSLGFTRGVVFSRVLIVYLSLFSRFQESGFSQKPQRMQIFLFGCHPRGLPMVLSGGSEKEILQTCAKNDCICSLHLVGRDTSASEGSRASHQLWYRPACFRKGWSVSPALGWTIGCKV